MKDLFVLEGKSDMYQRNSGFTLVELLCVIAIIGLLAAFLYPVFATAKQKANQVKCMSNMSQIGKAILMYVDDNNDAIPFAWNQQNRDRGWDSNTWRERVQKYLKSEKILICPVPSKEFMYKTHGHYGINVYITLNDLEQGNVGWRRLSSISRPTKTILVSENKEGDWSGEPLHNSVTGSEGRFCPYHSDGVSQCGNFVFCDGHTVFMPVKETEKNKLFYWRVIKKYN